MSDLFGWQPPKKFGTEPRKLHRRDDPDTSRVAAHSVDTTTLEQMVYDAIKAHRDGCIANNLLDQFPDFAYSSITARFKALQDKGLIICGPDKRPGRSGRQQRVMRAKP